MLIIFASLTIDNRSPYTDLPLCSTSPTLNDPIRTIDPDTSKEPEVTVLDITRAKWNQQRGRAEWFTKFSGMSIFHPKPSFLLSFTYPQHVRLILCSVALDSLHNHQLLFWTLSA